jgi:RNA polymerase sigma-70 factor (ECF subfamily)
MLQIVHEQEVATSPTALHAFDRREWLVNRIHCHEAQLRGYLRRFLSSPSDITDCVQESYARLLSLADRDLAAIRCPHAFLFTTARNVALEWLRKQQIINRNLAPVPDMTAIMDNTPSPYEQLNQRQELELLANAVASLPIRCRQVLTLRKLDGVSQRDIAQRLRISENTVEKHARNGVRLCAEFLRARLERTSRSRAPLGAKRPITA